ncbi:MAG: 23S rRNA (guanosine(2251)-2'-O)-methyltransferase RlmB [bacterium]
MVNDNKNNQRDIVFGRHAVQSVLEQKTNSVERVWVQKGLHYPKRLQDLIHDIAGAGAVVQVVDRPALDRITGSANHQGVAVRTALVSFHDLEEWLNGISDKKVCVLILDRIQDPGNLGAIFRTAAAAGVDAIIVPRHSMAPLGGAAMKASAGTLHRIPVIKAGNLRQVALVLKERGFRITGISEKGLDTVENITSDEKKAFVFGSEGRGIRLLLQKECDEILRIPLTGPAGSLNVSASVAIVLYEYVCRLGNNSKKYEKNS